MQMSSSLPVHHPGCRLGVSHAWNGDKQLWSRGLGALQRYLGLSYKYDLSHWVAPAHAVPVDREPWVWAGSRVWRRWLWTLGCADLLSQQEADTAWGMQGHFRGEVLAPGLSIGYCKTGGDWGLLGRALWPPRAASNLVGHTLKHWVLVQAKTKRSGGKKPLLQKVGRFPSLADEEGSEVLQCSAAWMLGGMLSIRCREVLKGHLVLAVTWASHATIHHIKSRDCLSWSQGLEYVKFFPLRFYPRGIHKHHPRQLSTAASF